MIDNYAVLSTWPWPAQYRRPVVAELVPLLRSNGEACSTGGSESADNDQLQRALQPESSSQHSGASCPPSAAPGRC